MAADARSLSTTRRGEAAATRELRILPRAVCQKQTSATALCVYCLLLGVQYVMQLPGLLHPLAPAATLREDES